MSITTEQEIKLRGVPCVIEIRNDGITIRRKGTRRAMDIPWEKIGKVAQIPDKAPAKYLPDPLGYLCADMELDHRGGPCEGVSPTSCFPGAGG